MRPCGAHLRATPKPPMFLTPAIAKAHLRIIDDNEAADVALKSEAAELAVIGHLDRTVYLTQAEMDTAVAAQPAALSGAMAVWVFANAAADLIADETLRLAEKKQAHDVYTAATFACARVRRGIVINSLILSEMLLALEALYERRSYTPTGLLDSLRHYGA